MKLKLADLEVQSFITRVGTKKVRGGIDPDYTDVCSDNCDSLDCASAAQPCSGSGVCPGKICPSGVGGEGTCNG